MIIKNLNSLKEVTAKTSNDHSIEFDGINTRLVDTGDITPFLFEGDDPWSACAWVKLPVTAVSSAILGVWRASVGWVLYVLSDGTLYAAIQTGGGGSRLGFARSTADIRTPNADIWMHIGVTKPNVSSWTNSKLFVNGVDTAATKDVGGLTDPHIYNASQYRLTFGGTQSNWDSSSMTGKVFSARVWDRELSVVEMQIEANNKTRYAQVTNGLMADPNIATAIYTGTPPYTVQDNISGFSYDGINLAEEDKTTDIPT